MSQSPFQAGLIRLRSCRTAAGVAPRSWALSFPLFHFNHNCAGPSRTCDQEFVGALAREHDLEFHVDGEDVAQACAKEEHISVETAARELRVWILSVICLVE